MNEVASISVDVIDIEAILNTTEGVLTDAQFLAACAHCENELNQVAAQFAAVRAKLEIVRSRRAGAD